MIDWGSIPDWLSAMGALGALIAASLAVRAAFKTGNQQNVQIRLLEEAESRRLSDLRQRDASLLAVWMGLDREINPIVFFVNGSGLPVFHMTIWMATPDALLSVFYYSYGPNAARALSRTQERMLVFVEECGSMEWEAVFNNGQLQAAAVFRDTASRWWVRKFDGNLVSVVDENDGTRIVGEDYREHWPSPES